MRSKVTIVSVVGLVRLKHYCANLQVCIPMGRLSAWQKKAAHAEKSPDITFMEQLLAVIEDSGIPAHSPIEQRHNCAM